MAFKFLSGDNTSSASPILRPVLFVFRFLQWASAVIVMGLASNYIHKFSPQGQHIIYAEVISTTATAFYIFPLAAVFLKSITWQILPLDLIYSYLWLTAFIFEAQDYNWQDCVTSDPSVSVSGEHSCSQKYALESFSFLAFMFTFFALLVQTYVWHKTRPVAPVAQFDKEGARASADSTVV